MIWLRMLRPYRGRLAVLFPAVVLGVCATLSAPLVLRYGIDHGLSDHIDAGNRCGNERTSNSSRR